MRSIALVSGVAALWVFAGCSSSSSNGSSPSGGASSATSSASGGSGGSGVASGGGGGEKSSTASSTAAGGTGGGTVAGGTTSTGGTRTSGGTPAGGSANSGGRTGSGGNSASGGTSALAGTSASGGASTNGGGSSGGKAASGGTGGAGGKSSSESGTGGGTASDYKGPCDVLASGCAEAYGMARAMTAKYTGPLFQLGLTKDKSKTLDIGQTSDRKADMTTWSEFCGGSQSNCVVSKIYAQINSKNDLVPAVFNAPYGPNCSAGGYTCAAKFTIETATSLPILTTDAPQEYTIAGDNFATGINGGKKAMGLMYNGKPVPNQVYCCGVFGLTHKYNAGDTHGTDFMVALAYGWRDDGGCCIAVNCGANNKYCVGAEEEENNDLYDYGSSPVENAVVVTQFDPTPNAVTTHMNGKQVMSHSPPKVGLNVGTAVHLGGGGDLSQPDPVRMREALVTNTVMSASEVTAMQANIAAFFSMLKFP